MPAAAERFCAQVDGGWPSPERWGQLFSSVVPVLLGGPEEPHRRPRLDLDSFLSDISDTLFTMTQTSPPPLQLPTEDGEAHLGVRVGVCAALGPPMHHFLPTALLASLSPPQPTWAMLT